MNLRELYRSVRTATDTVVGINRRNVELVYGHNRRRDYPLVDDKIVCKALLEDAGVPVVPTLAVCPGLFAVDGVIDALRDDSHFVVKPARGSKGEGILVLGDRTRDGWLTAGGRPLAESDLRQHVANVVFGAYSKNIEDRALIERRVVNHEVFGGIFDQGLSDIRIVTLRGRHLMAMARVPTLRSGGKANLHQGGVGLAIDLATGRTTRAVIKGRSVDRHPDTDAPMVGLQVPGWDAILEVATRAAGAVPLGYIGADLAIDAELGPVVIELNARPGLEIQNVNGRPLGPIVEAADAEFERASVGRVRP